MLSALTLKPRIIESTANAKLASDSLIPPTPLETILTLAFSVPRSSNAAVIASHVPPTSVLTIILSTFLEGQSETNLVLSGNYIFTNNNKDVFYSKIIDEKYPNYNAVIPEENPLRLTAKKTEMLNNIRAASIATNKNTNQISLHLTEGKVYFKSVNQPESKTVIAPLKTAKYAGDEISIGFNAIYLKEAVSKYPNDEVIFSFKDSLSATLFLPNVEDQQTTILLMPVRINE